ncbi:unnamed protein product [Rangifer tarandus platyrhynchus]|uniref:Uncharacterized protein n=1 Tax=Rangifer tarandus platyrhynchus TaxID=3082113 RepID=A0AC59Y4C6_RANTA
MGRGFLYRALGFPPATGLEAGKVEVLLLEWLYKTDHSDDFDLEVSLTEGPSLEAGDGEGRTHGDVQCVASCCQPQMLVIYVYNPITAKIIHHYSSSCQTTLGAHKRAVPR